MTSNKKKTSSYRRLKSAKIIQTIEVLHQRINERFPNSGLSDVCLELQDLATETKDKIAWIQQPNYLLRTVTGILVILLIFTSLSLVASFEFSKLLEGNFGDFENLEALTGIIIALGATAYFFITFEDRIKRHRALESLRDLKAIAHVIDMHQLTKDPSKLVQGIVSTKSSPPMDMNAPNLIRYLDYCTEMLSLIGKIAALYGQNLRDANTIATVNEIENMTTGLSRKIWQKIMILNKLQRAD